MKKILKHFRHIIELTLLIPFLILLYVLPMSWASAIMGKLLEFLGPLTKAHKTAISNLQMVFPHKNTTELYDIASKMWNNLGRVFGELLHWYRVSDDKFLKLVNIQDKTNGNFNKDQAAMVISAHYGNWEMLPRFIHFFGLKMTMVYRVANNPYTDYLINFIRLKLAHKLIAKSKIAGLQIFKSFKKKEFIGLLLDQRDSNGEKLNFFNKPALTSTTPIEIVKKAGVPIYLIRTIRNRSCSYTIELEEFKFDSNDSSSVVMSKLHKVFEDWIIEHPEMWFWVHQRWK